MWTSVYHKCHTCTVNNLTLLLMSLCFCCWWCLRCATFLFNLYICSVVIVPKGCLLSRLMFERLVWMCNNPLQTMLKVKSFQTYSKKMTVVNSCLNQEISCLVTLSPTTVLRWYIYLRVIGGIFLQTWSRGVKTY